MPDLNSLVLFAHVVEANGFSAAARRLRIPTSTLSRRIADLEDQLGLRLLERSTRSLRLTPAGADLLPHAQCTAQLSDAVHHTASTHLAQVAGTLRLSTPPSLSDSLLAPLIHAFQTSFPDVRIQVFVTERAIDPIADAIDLMFRVGSPPDPTLVQHPLLTYRHQLVATPTYLAQHPPPRNPADLLSHRLLAFSFGKPDRTWTFLPAPPAKPRPRTLRFQPFLSMNDYAGLAQALLANTGIGDLPPLVQPDLLRSGRLVELMPAWRFRSFDLSLCHLRTPHITRPVRLFAELATRLVPTLFPNLPA